MILTVNSDYFLTQCQPVDLYNGEELCFLCGTDWIPKYYLHKKQKLHQPTTFITMIGYLLYLAKRVSAP
jgi:hypothetical protein